MNQILVTEKLYITPELKRKKKVYKIQFFLSVLLVCLLSSYYIYAEYDRNKSEEVSQVILEQTRDETTKTSENDPIIIVLNEEEANQAEEVSDVEGSTDKSITVDGVTYSVDSFITIPKIGISYPVLSDTSDDLLEISVNRYWPEVDKLKPNEVGNYCIVGHNYRSGAFFGNNDKLQLNEKVYITDTSGTRIRYNIYNIYETSAEDGDFIMRETNGKREISLSTCTNNSKARLIIWAVEE